MVFSRARREREDRSSYREYSGRSRSASPLSYRPSRVQLLSPQPTATVKVSPPVSTGSSPMRQRFACLILTAACGFASGADPARPANAGLRQFRRGPVPSTKHWPRTKASNPAPSLKSNLGKRRRIRQGRRRHRSALNHRRTIRSARPPAELLYFAANTPTRSVRRRRRRQTG